MGRRKLNNASLQLRVNKQIVDRWNELPMKPHAVVEKFLFDYFKMDPYIINLSIEDANLEAEEVLLNMRTSQIETLRAETKRKMKKLKEIKK